jgi:hypothetical protein
MTILPLSLGFVEHTLAGPHLAQVQMPSPSL